MRIDCVVMAVGASSRHRPRRAPDLRIDYASHRQSRPGHRQSRPRAEADDETRLVYAPHGIGSSAGDQQLGLVSVPCQRVVISRDRVDAVIAPECRVVFTESHPARHDVCGRFPIEQKVVMDGDNAVACRAWRIEDVGNCQR